MARSEAHLREAQRLAHVGSWNWDVETHRLEWSAELADIFGVPTDSAPERFCEVLERVHPADRDGVRAFVGEALTLGRSFDVVTRIRTSGGELRWLRNRGRADSDATGTVTRILGSCQDVSEQMLAEEGLTRLSLHDPLTGLANRALFVEQLAKALVRLAREDPTVAVLSNDLDRFKQINDHMGHGTGDLVLIAVAERLQSIVRPTDTVARLGGDEFAIVCGGLASKADPIELAERVLALLSEPIELPGGRVATTGASVGMVLAADGTTNTESMLRDADAAMYKAKEAGRNRYVVFDNELRMKSVARLQKAEELHRGIERSEFRVLYQPIIDLHDDRWIGVEALVRWAHPERGLLMPDDFIGVAEETGSIVPLGAWVLDESCREAASWAIKAPNSDLLMAVNLSARQLTEPSLVATLQRSLDSTGLDPARLCLEITESVLMTDVERSIEVLLGLKALGVCIAVDDFGTGYSSLSYLRRFPVDVVKVDRSFVAGVGRNAADDAIIAAVVNLSHALGLRVIAEGVETPEQLIAVRALGCDHAQGYLWSRPIRADELDPWAQVHGSSHADGEPVDLYRLLVERTESLRAVSVRPVVFQATPRLATAVADKAAVRTILDHLIENAVNYSAPELPVMVSAKGDRHWVRVSVTDFGIGMTREQSSRCFEQFWQARVPDAAGRRGAGIGLSIVRALVESMGGHVGVRSVLGKGSTFTFALPRSTRAAARSRPLRGSGSDVSEDSTIREFMRQIGVPSRSGA